MHNRFRDILLMRKTGKVVSDSSMFDKRLGSYLNDRDYGGIITTATGNPISIITNKAQNAISTILSYSPRQSGSGDPSPINICPIVPWTEANLTGAGKNILAKSFSQWQTIPDTLSECFFIKAGTYSFSFLNNSSATTWRLGMRMKDSEGNDLSDSAYRPNDSMNFNSTAKAWYWRSADSTTNTLFTIVKDCYIRVCFGGGDSEQTTVFNDVQLELGSTATTYEPYTQGANNTISLGGTYYGFSIDVERGVLRSSRAIAILNGTENWILLDAVGKFYVDNATQNAIQQNPDELLYLCNKYIFRGTGASRSTSITSDKSVYGQLQYNRVWIYDSSFTTLEALKASLADTPLQFVYPITPIELPLTPQTVALLAGNNTIWTDGDEVSVTYTAKRG